MRNDPCNVKDDQQLREDCGNSSYKNFDSCKNFIDETTYGVWNAAGKKWKIRRYTSKTLFM